MKNIILGFLAILAILGMLYYFTKVKEGFTDNLGAGPDGPPPGIAPFNPISPENSKDAMRPEGMITWPLGITGPYLAEYAKKYRENFIDPVINALGNLEPDQRYPDRDAFLASPYYKYLETVLTNLEDWGINYLTAGISDPTKRANRIAVLKEQGIKQGTNSDIVVGTFVSPKPPYDTTYGPPAMEDTVFAELPVTALNPLAWESATSGASSQPSTLNDSYEKAMASPNGYSRPNGSKEPGTLVEINKDLLNPEKTPNFTTDFPDKDNKVGSMVKDWTTKTKTSINPGAVGTLGMTFSISYHDKNPGEELGPVLKPKLDSVKTYNKIITIGDEGAAYPDGTFLFKECQMYSGPGRASSYTKAKQAALNVLTSDKYKDVPADFTNALRAFIETGIWDQSAQNADANYQQPKGTSLKRDILKALNPTMPKDVIDYLTSRTWIASLIKDKNGETVFKKGFSPYSGSRGSGVDGKRTFMTARQGGALGTGLYDGNLYINVMDNSAKSLDPTDAESVKEFTFFGVTIGDGAGSTGSRNYPLKDISFAREGGLPIVSMITDPSGKPRIQFLNAAKGIAQEGGKIVTIGGQTAGTEQVVQVDVRQGPADASGDPGPPPRPPPRPGPGPGSAIITRGGPFESCFTSWTQTCADACEGNEKQCAEDLANDDEVRAQIGDRMASDLAGINGGSVISEFKTSKSGTILNSKKTVSQISESWYGDKTSFARNPPCVYNWNPQDCDPEKVGGTFNIGETGTTGRESGTGGAWRTFAAYMPGGEAGFAATRVPSFINATSMLPGSRANTNGGGGDPLIYNKDARGVDMEYTWESGEGSGRWDDKPVAGYMNTGNDLIGAIFDGAPALSKKELRREERRLRKLRRKERKSRRRRERRLSSKRNNKGFLELPAVSAI